MPKGDWLHRIAVGGILAASLCLALSSEGNAQGNPAAQPAESQQQQPAPAPPPVVQQTIPEPGYYTTDCQRPKDHDAADLCEQRRQAQAGEDAVWWARLQTILGVLGMGGVLATLVYSHLTLRHSSVTTRRQLRAYVSVETGGGSNQGQGRGVRFEFRPVIVNNGETPAYNLQVVSTIKKLPHPIPAGYDFSLQIPPDASTMTMGKGQNRFTTVIMPYPILTKAELKEISKGQTSRLYVYGRIQYRDIFGDDHYTNYCYAVLFWSRRKPMWNTTALHNDSN